jgi:hypothetical protein
LNIEVIKCVKLKKVTILPLKILRTKKIYQWGKGAKREDPLLQVGDESVTPF